MVLAIQTVNRLELLYDALQCAIDEHQRHCENPDCLGIWVLTLAQAEIAEQMISRLDGQLN